MGVGRYFEAQAKGRVKLSFIGFMNDHIAWSKKAFGDEYTYQKIIKHIEKELDEIKANPTDLEEWVDVIFLAMDGAWRAGYNSAEVFQAMTEKQEKNISREWVVGEGDEPNEHVR